MKKKKERPNKLSPYIITLFRDHIKLKQFSVTTLVEELQISRPTATKLVKHLIKEEEILRLPYFTRTNWFKRTK